ncbi:hypothetical protein Tco_0262319 [Tanacetum coccineum]
MFELDIDTLTMEQYLALARGNQTPGVVKPAIRNNVNFEIKIQFMRDLREDTFSRNKNDDAHEHVERVLDIVSLFNTPGVTRDAVMLRVFPITLIGVAKRWFERIPLDNQHLGLSQECLHSKVGIYQKSQEKSQKRASTNTRIRRVHENQ